MLFIYILQPNIKILQSKLQQLYNSKTSKISQLGVVKKEEKSAFYCFPSLNQIIGISYSLERVYRNGECVLCCAGSYGL